jgi:transcriptional regulator with PAS, ATPase and Fis domain
MNASDVDFTATNQAKSVRSFVTVRAANLEVTVGPDVGRRVRIDSPTFVVGTGAGADLRLTDPTVSREQLRISLLPSGVCLRDEGSKNGTWISGLRISEIIADRDVGLEMGSTSLMLHIESGPLDLPLSEKASFGDAIGVSVPMRNLFATLELVSASDATVLLEGESGAGKEVLARAIHGQSARASGPFVACDLSAIPATLIESELFGHERGAFTGAVDSREGAFEQAHGGTIFLDEIGELPLDMQPKLLRAIEQREVRPLGARGSRPFDARIIAATNRRLLEAANKGEFRRDLFYRLAVVRVIVPPLRDRREDILPLASRFLRIATRNPSAELGPELAALLTSYSWPGNVRELRNVIERHAVLGVRDAEGLFDRAETSIVAEANLAQLPFHEARRRVLDRFERAYLSQVLERAGGVVSRAAELAEVARPSLYRMLDRLRIARDRDPSGE